MKMSTPVVLHKARKLMKKAVKEHNNHNYEKAVVFYDESEKYFLHAIEFGGYSEKLIEIIRTIYEYRVLNRAEELRNNLKREIEECAREDYDDSEKQNDKKNENRKWKFLCCHN